MERGAYVFRDSIENETCLFLFQKLSESMMKIALPCHAEGSGDYYIAIYKGGLDYLGRTEYSGIEKLMKDEKMFNLYKDSYQEIKEGLNNNFSEDEYVKYQTFSEMHAKGFIDLAKKYCVQNIKNEEINKI
tara:strand:- start:1937 stop:2329 length:393 start_codon:yes stop_codon:yes gene_type:complete